MFKGIFRWKPRNEKDSLHYEIEENFDSYESAEKFGESRPFDKVQITPHSRNVAVPVIIITAIIILSLLIWSIQ